MGDQLGWAEYKLSDTGNTLDTVLAYVHTINDQTRDTATRLRTLFRQDKREDPVRAAARKELLNEAVKQLSEDHLLLDQIRKVGTASFTAKGKPAQELNEDELRSTLAEAITIAINKREAEKYKIEVKSPSKVTENELDRFAELVTDGGEVTNGLRERLETASALGFLRYDGKIVGTAALKKPAPNYRKGVFEKAQSKQPISSYPYELGWVFLDPAHRGKMRMVPLIIAVMKRAKGSGVFATTRTSNDRMLHILTRQGFVRDGATYASTQNPGEELVLLLHAPKSASKSSGAAV